MTPGSRFANAVHRLAAPPEQSHGLSAYWLAVHSLCQELTGYTAPWTLFDTRKVVVGSSVDAGGSARAPRATINKNAIARIILRNVPSYHARRREPRVIPGNLLCSPSAAFAAYRTSPKQTN
mmetsp:Transcript_34720/g.107372  ORF Transcript_34720/g.107372 Transcript_34720/m.107372 type:complete len:122 (-) Transcript_34720:412-777(-)